MGGSYNYDLDRGRPTAREIDKRDGNVTVGEGVSEIGGRVSVDVHVLD